MDKSNFTQEPYLLKNPKPWGYELIFTKPELPYSGKLLHIQAGARLSLQYHDAKQESYLPLSGRCNLIYEDSQGKLQTLELQLRQGYSIKVGQQHRLQAITDCEVLEAATPEIGTTYRLEDDYARTDETEEVRKQERQ